MRLCENRLQLAGGKEKYGDMGNCFRTVLKEEGPFALFKGAHTSLLSFRLSYLQTSTDMAGSTA